MQLQQKDYARKYNGQLLLLPIAGSLFLKKPILKESSEENSLDFHLNMIKKIDTLLQERGKETPFDEPIESTPANAIHAQAPVELRPPLGRRPDHEEIDLQNFQQPSFMKNRIIPEEFKTDLSLGIEPEFKFITSLDAIDNVLHFKPNHRDRIEVIDLGDFATDDVSSHLTAPFTTISPHAQQKPTATKKGQSETPKPIRTEKMEVIDARVLKQKAYENAFAMATKQNEEIEKKSQIYYLTSKGKNEPKQKKMEFKGSYIPEDFEERSKKIKEKQQQEEQQKRQLEEKIKKQLEKEREKPTKLESKKTKTEEKKQQGQEKEQKKEQEKEQIQQPNEQPTKKQLKEQIRLERLAARKAKIEERLKRKKEKQELKGQQKKSNKKEKYTTQSTELDQDIKKVLLVTDALLSELPEDVINRFTQSDDFELYEKVLNKYKIR
jgi:chemotaxis protein histidine kinase CheA